MGLKDSSASMIYFQRLLALFHDRPDFTLLVGPERLLSESVLLGGHGGINGGANFHPRLYVQLYEGRAESRPRPRGRAAPPGHADQHWHLQRGRFGSSYLKGVKCALSLMGICNDFMAEPFHRFNPPERARVEQELRALGLLPVPRDGDA